MALICLRLYFLSASAFLAGALCAVRIRFCAGPAGRGASRAFASRAHLGNRAARCCSASRCFSPIVYLLGLQSSFEGFQAVHGLVLGSIYLYTLLRDSRQRGDRWPALPFFAACASPSLSCIMRSYSSISTIAAGIRSGHAICSTTASTISRC